MGEKIEERKRGKRWDIRFFAVCLIVFFAGIVIDLATKAWAEYYFTQDSSPSYIVVIPGFLNLTLTYNSGMAFSMFSDNGTVMDVITWLTVPLIIFLLGVAFALPDTFRPHRIFVSLVAAGAFGNFIDRVVIAQGVRDFMDISSIGFGVCNFADYFITVGGVLLLLCLLFVGEDSVFPLIGRKKKKKDGKENGQGS